jgi:hypothetical protein
MLNTRTTLLVCALPALLFVAAPTASKKLGILPFDVVKTVNVGSLTRIAGQACGQCHRMFSGPDLVAVKVEPTARVIPVGASTSVKISGTSTTPSKTGGFVADVTSGTFVAGTNTRIGPFGNVITHADSIARSWTFSWKAPATGGLAECYVVVNATNDDLSNAGDSWSFHGSSPRNATCTPVRFYANAKGAKATGESCPDGYGNYSVLGVPEAPAIGTSTFRLEGFGLPPAAPLLVMVSIGGNVPGFDLKALGAPGCVLRTKLTLEALAVTKPGNAMRSEGSFTLPLPIPNQTSLRGLVVAAQFMALDKKSTHPFPVVVTNGIEFTIF